MMTTAATRMNPRIVSPPWRARNASRISLPLANPAANALEREAGDVVPVEPDEERAPADVVVGDESPVTTVVARVAVVSHHEIVTRRHLAPEAAVIVFAILATGERADAARLDGRCLRTDGNRVLARRRARGLLESPLGGLEAHAFDVAVAAIGALRQGLAVHRELLVAVFDGVAADADDPLDEILRRIHRVPEHDDIAMLRIAKRDDFPLEDRQPEPVGELVDQDVVADDERGPHRRRRDAERLGEKRPQQEHDQEYREEALR